MTDDAKIRTATAAIRQQLVADDESATAREQERVKVHEAIYDQLAAIEAALDGDAPGLPELNIRDAQSVQAGEVARFGVAISGSITDEAAQVTWTASNGETDDLPLSPGNHTVVIDVRTSVGHGAGTLTVTLSDPIGCTIGDATATCMVMPVTGNGNGGGNPARPIEPVNQSLHQVTLTVASDAPTHVWEGAGTGLNTEEGARAVFERVKQHRAKLDRIGMDVLRIFSPQTREKCVAGYKPYFDLFKPRLVVASGFVYRSSGPVRNNIRALADGVKYCWDHGLPIHIVTLQNEPDGNPGNKPRVDNPGEAIGAHQRWLREDLDSLGLQRVRIAALEWRHPPNGGIPEFDALKAAGLIGRDKAVGLGCGHVYDKVQGLDLADRLRSVGCTWSSWETGNNGTGCSSVARALSAANLGSAFDCLHYVMVTTPTPNPEQMGQAFLDFNGNPRPWTPHWEVAFGKALVPESTIYRCSSSDRAPGMPTTMDQWMVRNAAVSGGRNPRLNVVVGRRQDGKTAITATNTTHGTDAFSPYTGGHYGLVNQQHTLWIPWLAGRDGSFEIWRASPDGAVSGPQVVGMDAGRVRWSVSGGQTVGLVGGAA